MIHVYINRSTLLFNFTVPVTEQRVQGSERLADTFFLFFITAVFLRESLLHGKIRPLKKKGECIIDHSYKARAQGAIRIATFFCFFEREGPFNCPAI